MFDPMVTIRSIGREIYVCSNDKVVLTREKWLYADNFSRGEPVPRSNHTSYRIDGSVAAPGGRHTLNVACIIANNQQVNRANSIDSTAECHNSFKVGLGKTESNLLIKCILPRRDFALSCLSARRSRVRKLNSPKWTTTGRDLITDSRRRIGEKSARLNFSSPRSFKRLSRPVEARDT